ncbi:hypothetical protein SYNPS1DRAFT_25346 [Syncephalis pseudoplumigaleata]|uniref:Transmembrane protein n=1 Tax=Syncephalis pseudoplumigaleata TaxID=1712513 RepID=A0A4V1J0U5_9FUNG|nr:hypothetical protein SYNPS1DRAFT_25346 [Syncephalis pseudoplumigaleata]|eukprot:RKP22779.1 hypothetical protein SYNPS1DRAFT_25346 [Syncephalis pseudoplumigaleata]
MRRLATIPATTIKATVSSANSNKHRPMHNYSLLASALITVIILVLAVLDGWSHVRGMYSNEMLFHRLLNAVYVFSLFAASWLIWKHGWELSKRAKNRATIMEQYPQRTRNHASFVITSALETAQETVHDEAIYSRSATGKAVQHDPNQLRHSQFRLGAINWALLITGIFFGVVTLVYAIILQLVVESAWLGLIFHLLLNVLTTLAFLLMMIVLAFSISHQRELEQMKHDCMQRTTDGGGRPYADREQTSVHAQTTMDIVEASRLSAAIATLQAEVRLEPLVLPEDILIPPPPPIGHYEGTHQREHSRATRERLKNEWMYCALRARDSVAKE